jgi:hypothetical protein
MPFIKEIPEEEQLQDDKNNKQFNQDYDPNSFAPPRQIAETVEVKPKNSP